MRRLRELLKTVLLNLCNSNIPLAKEQDTAWRCLAGARPREIQPSKRMEQIISFIFYLSAANTIDGLDVNFVGSRSMDLYSGIPEVCGLSSCRFSYPAIVRKQRTRLEEMPRKVGGMRLAATKPPGRSQGREIRGPSSLYPESRFAVRRCPRPRGRNRG